MAILVEAPTRIDLAGGTLDIYPLSRLLHQPLTVQVAIDLKAQVQLSKAPDDVFKLVSQDQGLAVTGTYEQVVAAEQLPLVSVILQHLWAAEFGALELTLAAQSPPGAGLGGSSALALALVAAVQAAKQQLLGAEVADDLRTLVQLTQDLEASLIRVPTGCQDYWAAACGGVNVLSYPPGGTVVTGCEGFLQNSGFAKQVLVFFSGQSRASATNNWHIFRQAFDGDRETLGLLQQICDSTQRVALAVQQADSKALLAAMAEEWELRCQLCPDMTTEVTQELDRVARSQGAALTRVCGAGGGGVMVAFFADQVPAQAVQAISEAGGKVLPVNLGVSGLKVTGVL